MAKKRARVSDQAAELAPPPSTVKKLAGEKEKTKRRQPHRGTYDIGKSLKDDLKQQAALLGVPTSQLVRYLLTASLDDLRNGRLADPPLVPSASPAYRNVIDFDDD